MPNPIKYTTGTETLALKKGNFYIGTGDVGKGPSDVTGFYQGLSPSEGGYVIYMNREGAPGDLSYHVAANDSELISFTNNLAGQSYTTVQECLVYYASQSDKVVLNRDYESIITDGLVLNVDAGFTPSYPTSNTTWYDLAGTNNGTLTNGPTFDSNNGGSIVFDGVNDVIMINDGLYSLTGGTLNTWAKRISGNATFIGSYGGSGSQRSPTFYSTNTNIGWEFSNLTGQNTGIPFITGKWFNLGITYNNNYNIVIYVDGSPVVSTTAQNPGGFWDQFTIGRYGNYGNSFFNGYVSTVQVYNRALSADEVLQNFNAQKGRFGL